jgi:hypothetical protein
MPTRFGLRINPVSGTDSLGIAMAGGLGGSGIALERDGDTTVELLADKILDAGGGTLGFFGPMSAFALSRSVAAGAPWESWYDTEDGDYTSVRVTVIIAGASPENVRIRFFLEEDGDATELFNVVASATESPFSGTTAETIQSVSFTISSAPPSYSNFWTGFNRTRENAPT